MALMAALFRTIMSFSHMLQGTVDLKFDAQSRVHSVIIVIYLYPNLRTHKPQTPHLRMPNPGFNPGFTPLYVTNVGGELRG
jgi:hypothetical protein